MVRPTILIVDDEKRLCRSLEILLREEGPYQTQIATDYYEAIERLKEPIDLVLTDLTMPGKGGLDLLRAIRDERPNLPVILMTAYSTVESAVTAIKEGAQEYIVKPFENEDLLRLIRKSLSHIFSQVQSSDETVTSRFGDILGSSRLMQDVYYRISRAAETDSTVLITGESGTGKELVARAIHFSGSRKSKPFLALNCSALPEGLLESELFGHEKGAFTGAVKSREGKFELAEHGTLFLDEIGEVAPSVQVKLLRVLQDRAFERVGGRETLNVDVRIIAATNRDLATAVRNGSFREDLFYRLNVVTIHLPPLRDRKEDVPLLIEHFLSSKCRKVGADVKKLAPAARERLLHYDYPGNIRELENLIERAVVISRGEQIEASDLPLGGALSQPSMDQLSLPIEGGLSTLESMRERLERDVIERALKLYPEKSNTELAETLGTSRRVLEARLKQYGLSKS